MWDRTPGLSSWKRVGPTIAFRTCWSPAANISLKVQSLDVGTDDLNCPLGIDPSTCQNSRCNQARAANALTTVVTVKDRSIRPHS
jgi:hypothetical protein